MGVLQSFSIKNNFCDKTDLKLFCFHVTKCRPLIGQQGKLLNSRCSRMAKTIVF